MRLLLGTNNAGKAIEMAQALSDLPLTVVTPEELHIDGKPEETGTTYAENAILKALYFHGRSGLPTVADDSGIVVEALKDELGVYTRRWGAGPDVSDREWVDYFLKRMESEADRRAAFVCTLAYIDPDGTLHTFEGRCDGVIADALEADFLPGLPLSAAFRPNGYGRVFSALAIEEKQLISHRGRALGELRRHLGNG